MICNEFLKIEKYEGYVYDPKIEDYIFTEEFKKGKKPLEIEVPKEIKCKKAVPLLYTTSNSFNKLPKDIKLKAISLFFKYMYGISGFYPYSFKIEVKKGIFVGFTFSVFFKADYLDSPVAEYSVGVRN